MGTRRQLAFNSLAVMFSLVLLPDLWHRHNYLQGGVTPIGPVLTTATAVKMWSRGHGTSEAPVKRSSSKLVPTTVKIDPHLLFCIKLQSVTRPNPDLAIRSTEEHNYHDNCLHAQQLSSTELSS